MVNPEIINSTRMKSCDGQASDVDYHACTVVFEKYLVIARSHYFNWLCFLFSDGWYVFVCRCGSDGQMQCDPKICNPEPMVRKLMEAAVSHRRR